MSDYYPDGWVVIKIIPDKTIHPQSLEHYRVFACWRGSYVDGETWRMNSGIVSITDYEEDEEPFYQFVGETGSVYHCRKRNYGLTSWAHSVLMDMENRTEGATIDILPEDTDFFSLEYV